MTGSLPPFASVSDLAEWLGEPIDEENDQRRAGRILRAASNLVRSYTRRKWVDEDGTGMADLPEELADVTLSCAARYYTNPNAETQWTSQIDDVMDGGGRKVESSGIYLTESEQRMLDTVREQSSTVVAGAVAPIATTRGDAYGYESEGRFPWFVVTGS